MSASTGNQGKASEKDQAEQRAARESVLRMTLTSEARQRLANVRMVKPEIANAIEEYIIQIASAGRLKKIIDDDQLKQMLSSVQEKKRDFTIRRI
ncbi:MAG: DNA-binding protein [Thaumarchaeota archaeon]|nr:DNA-binding protein [Nitrososphaerota archaeon]